MKLFMNHSEAFIGEAIESIADDTLRDVAVDAAGRGTDAMHPAVANGSYDENRDGGRTMESSPDQKPRLGDQAAPEPRLIAASSGLVGSNLVEGILGSINPGRRTEPLTSSQVKAAS
jgi:hypothetical protein